MVKVLVVVAFLAVAQMIPSCGGRSGSGPAPEVGGQAQVIGWVEEKRTRVYETSPYMVVINQMEYGVPYEFWLAVGVGDLVKYQGGKWTIVRKAGR